MTKRSWVALPGRVLDFVSALHGVEVPIDRHERKMYNGRTQSGDLESSWNVHCYAFQEFFYCLRRFGLSSVTTLVQARNVV